MAASSRIAVSTVRSMGFNPSRFSRALYARNLFGSFSERFSRRGDTRITVTPTHPVAS